MKTKLKELRLQHQMTQEQLAKRINVSSRTIISLETGKYNPSIMLSYRLACVFKLSIEDLFCLQENLEEEERRNEKNL